MEDHDDDPPLDDGARDRSLIGDIRQLAGDARRLAEAEVAYQRARASFAGQELKAIVALGLVAAAMLFIAILALAFGLVLALTPHLTAWGATGVVVSGLVLATLACGTWAGHLWRRMRSKLSIEEPPS